MKTKTILNHRNETRESCWILLQHDDGTLHVKQSADYADGTQRERVLEINDFLRESGPPPRMLQILIDRLFDDG